MSGATCSAHVESIQIKSAGAFVDFPHDFPFFRFSGWCSTLKLQSCCNDRGLQPWQTALLVLPMTSAVQSGGVMGTIGDYL